MRRAFFVLFTMMLCGGFTVALAGACGGGTGLACLEGQFCKLPSAVCDPAAEGVCTDIPLDCPDVDFGETVCGCDSVEYDSRCHADLAGVSLHRRGPCDGTCGQVWGYPCNPGEICKLPFGECVLDLGGSCVPEPTECPAHCRPVCSCGGVTYRTVCDAQIVQGPTPFPVQFARYGSCGEVHGVRFLSADQIEWESSVGASGYNVYLDGDLYAAESAGPMCQDSELQTNTWDIPNAPDLGELWQIEITAQTPEGEGPIGMSSLCGNRQAGQPCGN